jgi:hypothetical protein
MSRKTRKQKKLAEERKNKTTSVNVAPNISIEVSKNETSRPVAKYNKSRFEYKETDYDKDLRKFTIRDITKTSIIIVSLFVVQYVIYLNFAPGK